MSTIQPLPTLAPPHPAARVLARLGGGMPGRLPGVALCLAVTAAAMLLEKAEAVVLGGTWLEALVLAILLGTAVRTAWTPGKVWRAGIGFSA